MATFAVGGLNLSGIERAPERAPRGIVLALHGGGYRAGYWDQPPGSLLAAAADRAMLGVAVDRPGYGMAQANPLPLVQQAELVLDLIAQLRQRTGGQPVLLVGHSMGGILALIVAAHPRAAGLVCAIEAGGVPLRFPAEQQTSIGAMAPPPGQTHVPLTGSDAIRAMFYGPDGTYDPGLATADLRAPVPMAELPDALHAPERLPAVMQQISIPVRLTFAEYERSSLVDDAIMAEARSNLAGHPASLVRTEPRTGHNLSLHHIAGAYHAGILDWFETMMDPTP